MKLSSRFAKILNVVEKETVRAVLTKRASDGPQLARATAVTLRAVFVYPGVPPNHERVTVGSCGAIYDEVVRMVIQNE